MSALCLAMSMECAGQKSDAVCLYERAATGLDISLGLQHANTLFCQQALESLQGSIVD